jgi:Uma2 family endonuclease
VKTATFEATPEVLAHRKLTGVDRWDEVWEGVLHMAPAPNDEHQRILDKLIVFLVPLFERKGSGTLRSGINVFDSSAGGDNYRIPDATFVAAGRESIRAADGIRGGAPDAVIEIRSPGDETYVKLAFFASLGVREVVIIDRDSKQPEMLRLAGSAYAAVAPDREGWVGSEAMGVRLRRASDASVLEVADADAPAVRARI